MPWPQLLGLDVGTTGCKAVLFDEDGTLLASASREYAVDLPHPGWAEQDIERVWALAMEAMRRGHRRGRGRGGGGHRALRPR